MPTDPLVVIDAIVRNARTGETSDGKIFVLPVEHVVRVAPAIETKMPFRGVAR